MLLSVLVKFSQSGKYYFADWEIWETSSVKKVSYRHRCEYFNRDAMKATVVSLSDEYLAAIPKPGRNATVDVWDLKLDHIVVSTFKKEISLIHEWSRTFEDSIGDVRVYKDHVCIFFNETKRISIWNIELNSELLSVPGDSFFGITSSSAVSWDYFCVHNEDELVVTRLDPLIAAKEIPLEVIFTNLNETIGLANFMLWWK